MTETNTQITDPYLQRIKAEEFEHFFRGLESDVHPFLNHLNEVSWMTDEEARDQHEFFDYHESAFTSFKKRFLYQGYPSWQDMTTEERELRLQFRCYLEQKFIGRLRSETAMAVPQNWQTEISERDIEQIPITLEIHESGYWRSGLLGSIAAVFLALVALSFFLFSGEQVETGSLVIESNVRGASIYLDEAKKGYADYSQRLENIPFGTYRVSLQKPGYVSIPASQEIIISDNTPLKIRIDMQKIAPENHGYLHIDADQQDSKVFINNEFMGHLAESRIFDLAEGSYDIILERNGFETIPRQQSVTISSGDTMRLAFSQRAKSFRSSRTASTSRAPSGTLEITSNISGARIYLNGEDTGKEADHVFTDIKPGNYQVKLVKKGFRSVPEVHTLSLSGDALSGELNFRMEKVDELVAIRTDPPNGNIYINGQLRGKGFFKENLPLGEHKISFGDLTGYKTPRERTISVKANGAIDIQADYFPEMRLVAEIAENGSINIENCEVMTGYTVSNQGFSSSSEAGPEIVFLDDLDNYYWKFGYAFPYRSPKGSDALKLSFRLPRDLNYNQKFTVKLLGATSDERYPLAINRKIGIKLKLNGNVINYSYEPKSIDDLDGMEEISFDISKFIRSGINSFEIMPTEKNNTYYLLKRITISNE